MASEALSGLSDSRLSESFPEKLKVHADVRFFAPRVLLAFFWVSTDGYRHLRRRAILVRSDGQAGPVAKYGEATAAAR